MRTLKAVPTMIVAPDECDNRNGADLQPASEGRP
jgi:hypothetical protein